jgi:hypothetical protein
LAAAATATIGVAIVPASATAPPSPCASWEVEYALAANLRLQDTPLGQGDGVYGIGPGRILLRFEDRDGRPGGRVVMKSFDVTERFTVTTKTLLWTTTVVTDARARATPNACSIAEGVLRDESLQWTSPVAGCRTDGTLTCEGTFCGKLGAPPSGVSELHIGPTPVRFQPFAYAKDMKTFTMTYGFVAKTDTPKQTAYMALAGREVRRSCAIDPPCH